MRLRRDPTLLKWREPRKIIRWYRAQLSWGDRVRVYRQPTIAGFLFVAFLDVVYLLRGFQFKVWIPLVGGAAMAAAFCFVAWLGIVVPPEVRIRKGTITRRSATGSYEELSREELVRWEVTTVDAGPASVPVLVLVKTDGREIQIELPNSVSSSDLQSVLAPGPSAAA